MPINRESLSAPMRAGIAAVAVGNIAVGLVAAGQGEAEPNRITPEAQLAVFYPDQVEALSASQCLIELQTGGSPEDCTYASPKVTRFATTNERGTGMRLAVPSPEPAPSQHAVEPVVEPAPAAAPAEVFAAACYQYEHLFAQYDWPLAGAMRTGSEESSCNPTVVSDTNDHGIMQINNGLALYGEKIYDPAFNIEIAYKEKYVTPRRGRRPNFSAWFAVCTKGLRPLFKEVHCQ